MLVHATTLKDCVIIEPRMFGDNRGFFFETFSKQRYLEEAGIALEFVQDNHSRSAKGVLRGLHFQKTKPQGKLVRVVRGCVFDVAVDIRPKSVTFGQWISVELSEQNKKQLWVPPGFAHGFTALSNDTELEYKCTAYYDPEDEDSILWSDPELSIPWPVTKPILSAKDADAGLLKDLQL
jgi:dTDP-4-dehydrorhamnose 3,5-epimerase